MKCPLATARPIGPGIRVVAPQYYNKILKACNIDKCNPSTILGNNEPPIVPSSCGTVVLSHCIQQQVDRRHRPWKLCSSVPAIVLVMRVVRRVLLSSSSHESSVWIVVEYYFGGRTKTSLSIGVLRKALATSVVKTVSCFKMEIVSSSRIAIELGVVENC
eukprot:3626137-Amphidinium_carterae.1